MDHGTHCAGRARARFVTGLAIWGASGHAKVVIDAVRLAGEFHVAVVLDDREPTLRPATFDGLEVIGGRERLGDLASRGIRHIIVAFGNCAARLDAFNACRDAGLELPTIVHPSAVVARSATLGAGTFVAAGAVINASSTVGDAVVVNTRSSVDHDGDIGSGAHICPGVTLAGGVSVGERTWVGAGSVVIHGVSIGAGTIIGAGSLVLRSIPQDVVAYGSPATIVRATTADDELVRYRK